VFCSAVRALESLPPETVRRLYALEALDVQLRDLTGRNRLRDSTDDLLRCVHPLIRHLPVTGRPALYASKSGTDRVLGMSEEESEALLATLFDHLYRASNLYEHRWRTGDLVVWDNRALQHRRAPIPAGMRRTLQRAACAEPGTGIFDAFPQFMQRSSYASQGAG
jgi:taurine dioxygenase